MISAESTTKVTVSTESAPTPLVAVMVKGYVPVVVGVPDKTPVLLRVSPVGRSPSVTVTTGVGCPATVKVWL